MLRENSVLPILSIGSIALAGALVACNGQPSAGPGSVKTAAVRQGNAADQEGCLAPRDDVPMSLRASDDECLKLGMSAAGVQIYTCTASGMPATYSWVLKAPEASLYDDDGNYTANHFLGPKWQYIDGSKVGAEVQAREAHDPNVPWLLLRVTSNDFPGMLEDVTHVIRINTGGGNSPSTGCDAMHIGAETRIDYTAEYLFYHPRGNG